MKDFTSEQGISESSAGDKNKECLTKEKTEPSTGSGNMPEVGLGDGGISNNNTKDKRNMTLDLTQVVVSESEDEVVPIPGLSQQGGEMHCKIVNAFTKAFAKQNVHFEKGTCKPFINFKTRFIKSSE